LKGVDTTVHKNLYSIILCGSAGIKVLMLRSFVQASPPNHLTIDKIQKRTIDTKVFLNQLEEHPICKLKSKKFPYYMLISGIEKVGHSN